MRPQLRLVEDDYPATINADAFTEWRDYRQFKRKPLSEFAEQKTMKMLAQFTHEQQQQMVDTSIMNDWQGLFAPRVEKNTTRARTITEDLNDRSWAR